MIPAALTVGRANLGWLLLVALLAVIGAYQGGEYMGTRAAHSAAEAQRTAEKAAALTQLVDTMGAMAARAAEQAREDFGIAERHTAADRAITAMYRRMQNEVSEYVKTHPDTGNCGLDADGLRIWSQANAGHTDAAAAPAAGEPAGAVRGSAAADIGGAVISAEQSRGGYGDHASMRAPP